jgi:hypothetical protein
MCDKDITVRDSGRLYVAIFDFLCGEYEHRFEKAFYAKDEIDLELKVARYFKVYFGEGELSKVGDNLFYFMEEGVAVEYLGYEMIKDFEHLVNKLLW